MPDRIRFNAKARRRQDAKGTRNGYDLVIQTIGSDSTRICLEPVDETDAVAAVRLERVDVADQVTAVGLRDHAERLEAIEAAQHRLAGDAEVERHALLRELHLDADAF